MILTLFNTNKDLCNAWAKEFSTEIACGKVRVLCTDLHNLPKHQFTATAGNSYGIMDGGIDLAFRNILGLEVQDKVQWFIAQYYHGFLPVGEAVVVETKHEKCGNLIYAPTMEYPMTVNEWSAFKAMLAILVRTVQIGNVESLAVCGLGTGIGGVPPELAAKMMKKAYDVCYGGG